MTGIPLSRAAELVGLPESDVMAAISMGRVFGAPGADGTWRVSAEALPLLRAVAEARRAERPVLHLRISVRPLAASSSTSHQEGEMPNITTRTADDAVAEAVYIQERPRLRDLIAQAPQRARAALVSVFRDAERKGKALAAMPTDKLAALAQAGDEVAVAVLAERKKLTVPQPGALLSARAIRRLKASGLTDAQIAAAQSPDGAQPEAKLSERRKKVLRQLGIPEEEIQRIDEDETPPAPGKEHVPSHPVPSDK